MTTGWTERDRTNAGSNSNAGRHRETGSPDRYIFFYIFVLPAFLFFPIISFFVEYNDWRDGTGPTLAATESRDGAGQNRRQRERILFLFALLSLLFSILLLTLLLQGRAGSPARGRGGKMGRTDATQGQPEATNDDGAGHPGRWKYDDAWWRRTAMRGRCRSSGTASARVARLIVHRPTTTGDRKYELAG